MATVTLQGPLGVPAFEHGLQQHTPGDAHLLEKTLDRLLITMSGCYSMWLSMMSKHMISKYVISKFIQFIFCTLSVIVQAKF